MDQNGKSVNFFLSQRRDVGAAKAFFRRALQKHGDPLSITLDANAAWHRAVPEFKESGEILYQKMRVRSCASLHHVVEPDHRGVKRRVNPMLGVPILGERTRGDCRYRTRAEDRQETIRLATVRWHRREPRSRVAAGDGGLNTDGKEERFVLRLLGSGVCNRTGARHRERREPPKMRKILEPSEPRIKNLQRAF